MHETWQDMLPLYVNDGLTPEDRQALEAHLADCEDCRARLWGFRMLAQAAAEEAEIEALQETLPPLVLPVNSHTPQKSKHNKWRKNTMFVSMTRPIQQPRDIFAPFKRVMAGLVMDPAQPRRYSGITFAVSIAVTALVLVIIVAIGTQPSGDTSLSVQPIPVQQDTEVDCLADRAYRVVYAEELPSLTTEDLKCAFIVGDMRGLDISHLDFSDTVMRDVNMSSMELEEMRFDGSTMVNADLSEANLSGAWFPNANLKEANLTFADFTRSRLANTNLQSANLSGANLSNAGLVSANLRGADLSCADELVITEVTPEATEAVDGIAGCENPTIMQRTNLSDANLIGADLSDADLSIATMRAANMSQTKLQNANLSSANMQSANLHSANLSGANLERASLLEATVLDANFENTILSGANLNGISLQRTRVRGAIFSSILTQSSVLALQDFTDADLSHGDFHYAVIALSNFTRADLSNANFERADLIDVDLTGSDLTGVDLTGAAFTDVVWTDVTLPDGTLWTEGTDLTRFTDANHADYWRSDDPESPAYGGEEE